jgi:hypothetical protein
MAAGGSWLRTRTLVMFPSRCSAGMKYSGSGAGGRQFRRRAALAQELAIDHPKQNLRIRDAFSDIDSARVGPCDQTVNRSHVVRMCAAVARCVGLSERAERNATSSR